MIFKDFLSNEEVLIMNSTYISTAIALRDLHCSSLDTLDDRILLQKKVYLAQDIGLPLGYGYGWYIHGPYSTDLTAAAYQIIPEGFYSLEKKGFKPEFARMIAKVNALELENKCMETPLSRVEWYELLASIAYWYKRGKCELNGMIAKIKECKPQFTCDQTKVAYNAYLAFKDHSDGERSDG